MIGSLEIAGRSILVKEVANNKLPDAYGQWHNDTQQITVRKSLLPIEKKDTVLHEVMHAILTLQGRTYGGEVEELYVRSLATGLVGVLRTNPEFAQWLIAS